MKFSELGKSKPKKTEKPKTEYVKLDDVNKYLKDRKLRKLIIKEDRVIISLTDGRKIIAYTNGKIKVKYNDKCMSTRALQDFNERCETVWRKIKKSAPRECQGCLAVSEARDLL